MANDTGWQLNCSLVECNRYMLEHQVQCDVTFQVGIANGIVTDIKAHTYILSSRSPVFFAMLCGDLAEKQSEPIRLPDIEPQAFRQLLRYMYCDEANLSADTVLPILYASKKYLVPALTQKCTAFLESSLQPENVGLILEQSILYDEDNLVKKCQQYIESETHDVLNSASFLELRHSTLMTVLKFESLAVLELELYQSCLKWAEAECKRKDKDVNTENKREVLGEALYLIHFPSMPMKDFATKVSKTGVLTAEEKCSVFEYLACDHSDHGPHIDIPFPTTQRRKPLPSILKRFGLFGKSNVYSGDCSILKFLCDHSIIVKGIGVSGSISYDPLAEVQITMKQDRNFMCNKTISINDDRSGELIHVILPEAVSLDADTWYTIIVTFHFFGDHDQGSCRRGKGGHKTLTIDGVTFEFDRPDSAGFVPELLFSRS